MNKIIGVVLLMASVHTAALAGNVGRVSLKPETLKGITCYEGRCFLSNNTFAPDGKNRIFIEAEAQGCFVGNENYRKDPEASGNASVANLVGKYFFRVGEAGSYQLWARVKAPWHGHWSYKLRIEKAGQESEEKVEGGLPEGFVTAYGDEDDAGIIREEDGFRVKKEQIEKYEFIEGASVKLSAGDYSMNIHVPGKVQVDQFVFVKGGTSSPAKEFTDKKGEPIHGRKITSSEGFIIFQKLLPISFRSFGKLEFEQEGLSRCIAWYYRFPDKPDKAWKTLESRDLFALRLDGSGTDSLQLKLALKIDPANHSPVIGNSTITYERDDATRIRLETDTGCMHVSRLNGYWGQICKVPENVIIHSDDNAELPFYLSARKKGALNVIDIKQSEFHAENVDVFDRNDGWEIKAAYQNSDGKLKVKLVGTYRKGNAVIWQAQIENNSDLIVESFHFPVLTEVQIGDSYVDDNIAWLGYLRKPMTSLEGWRRSDPGQVTYFDVYDSKAALYMGVHDPKMNDLQFHLRPYGKKGPFSYRVEEYTHIKPGTRWESPRYAIAVHSGDWHYAADHFYRPWYQNEMPRPENPDWLVNDFNGFIQSITMNFEPTCLIGSYKTARFLGWQYVKAFLCQWPGPDFDPSKGGFDVVKRNVEWINRHGGQVDSYTDVYGCVLWQNSDFQLRRTLRSAAFNDFPQNSLDWLIKHRALTLKQSESPYAVKAMANSNYWPKQPYQQYSLTYCLQDEATHTYWEKVAELYARAGLNIYWDEAGNTHLKPCYSPLHEHIRPGHGHSIYGRVLCAQRMIKSARKIKPDFVIVGENYNDRVMSVVNVPYFQGTKEKYFWDEVVRYTHPNHIYNIVVIKNSDFFNRAFLFHPRMSSSDIFAGPGLTTWLRARMLLLQAAKDVSYVGRYMDNVGLTVEGDGLDARYVVLNTDTRSLALINSVNSKGIANGRIRLLKNKFPGVRRALVYTMEGKVRKIPFNVDEDTIHIQAPQETLSSILLCAKEEKQRRLRVSAMMPFLEPAPAKVRVALANVSDRRITGTVAFGAGEKLEPEKNNISFSLVPGDAEYVDVEISGRDRLSDFFDMPVNIRSSVGVQKKIVIVPPVVPDGSMEIDDGDNGQADFWRRGLRDFAEPHEGKYCLVVPPHIASDGSKCPYYAPEKFIHLLPKTEYTLQFHYRYVGKTPVHCSVIMIDEKNKLVMEKRVAAVANPAFDWKKVTADFTTPENTYKSYIRFSNCDDTGKGVNAWIDGIQIYERN